MADASVLPSWVRLDPTEQKNILIGSTSSYADVGDISLKITFSSVVTPAVT
jgi:hypothetical protein